MRAKPCSKPGEHQLRWEAALDRERQLRERLTALEAEAAARPAVDRQRLLAE